MARITKGAETRADLLAKVPPSATRIRVTTAKGDEKYKEITDLVDTDVIQVNKFGDPIVMKGSPGRKTVAASVGPATPTVAVLLQRKATAIGTDPILATIRKDPDSPDVLREVIMGLGEESASLRFERDEAARQGQDTSGMSAKRVQALRATAETWLKRMDQTAGKTIDLDSANFGVLFKFLMDTLKEAMNGAKMRPEQIETVFSKVATLVGSDEWKVEAKNRMKNA